MALPEPTSNGRAVARATQPMAPAHVTAIPVPDVDLDEISLPLTHYLWILRRHAWNLIAFVVTVVLATVIISARLTPIFESTTTLYVDRQEAKGVVGQESQVSSSSNMDAEAFLASQIKLLQSDSVVRPVAEKYDLLDKEKQIKNDSDATQAKDAPIVLKQLKVTRPPNIPAAGELPLAGPATGLRCG